MQIPNGTIPDTEISSEESDTNIGDFGDMPIKELPACEEVDTALTTLCECMLQLIARLDERTYSEIGCLRKAAKPNNEDAGLNFEVLSPVVLLSWLYEGDTGEELALYEGILLLWVVDDNTHEVLMCKEDRLYFNANPDANQLLLWLKKVAPEKLTYNRIFNMVISYAKTIANLDVERQREKDAFVHNSNQLQKKFNEALSAHSQNK